MQHHPPRNTPPKISTVPNMQPTIFVEWATWGLPESIALQWAHNAGPEYLARVSKVHIPNKRNMNLSKMSLPW